MEKSPSHSPLLSSPPSKMGSTAQVELTLTVLTYTVLHSVGKTENTSGFARTLRVGGAKWLVLSSKLHWDMTPLILEPKQWEVHELPSKVSPLTAANLCWITLLLQDASSRESWVTTWKGALWENCWARSRFASAGNKCLLGEPLRYQNLFVPTAQSGLC